MKELRAILEAYRTLSRRREEAVLATVVRARGSTYRKPGARMLIGPEGWLAGAVSGGCLEGHLLRRAFFLTASGPVLTTYDTAPDDADFGLGCGGAIEVLFERVGSGRASSLDALERALAAGSGAAVATVVSPLRLGEVVTLSPDGSLSPPFEGGPTDPLAREIRDVIQRGRPQTVAVTTENERLEVFVDPLRPPVSLFVFGHGYDIAPLCALGATMGWSITVVVTGPNGPSGPYRLPDATRLVRCPPAELRARLSLQRDSMCVLMTHNLERDRSILAELLPSPVAYIGLLGPRRRADELRDSLTDALPPSVLATWDDRVHGPIGLPIGGREPEEIALAIVAEVQLLSQGARARAADETARRNARLTADAE